MFDTTLLIDLFIRWMHIIGAIMLVGSTIFMRCVYVPARELSGEQPPDKFGEIIRWAGARTVMISSSQLLISGFVAFILIMKRYDIGKEAFPGSAYQMLFGIKFLIAMVVFFLAAALTGRSSLAQKLRQREKTWLTVNMTLAIIVVLIAGVMRMAARTEKPVSSASSTRDPSALVFDATSAPPAPQIN